MRVSTSQYRELHLKKLKEKSGHLAYFGGFDPFDLTAKILLLISDSQAYNKAYALETIKKI